MRGDAQPPPAMYPPDLPPSGVPFSFASSSGHPGLVGAPEWLAAAEEARGSGGPGPAGPVKTASVKGRNRLLGPAAGGLAIGARPAITSAPLYVGGVLQGDS